MKTIRERGETEFKNTPKEEQTEPRRVTTM